MKLMKPGREQKGWAKEFVCTGQGNGNGGCGATLLVEEGDVFRTSSCHQGEVDHFTTFRCCACGVDTDIEVPGHVKDKAPLRESWVSAHTSKEYRQSRVGLDE
jgi:hypothetical protein